jgi:hypothetical protein
MNRDDGWKFIHKRENASRSYTGSFECDAFQEHFVAITSLVLEEPKKAVRF